METEKASSLTLKRSEEASKKLDSIPLSTTTTPIMRKNPVQLDAIKDYVFIEDVNVAIPISNPHEWYGQTPQPGILSLKIGFDSRKAGTSDDIEDCLDYSKLLKLLNNLSASLSPARLKELACPPITCATEAAGAIAVVIGNHLDSIRCHTVWASIKLRLPKEVALTGGEAIVNSRYWSMETDKGRDQQAETTELTFKDMLVYCIVGVREKERVQKQPVKVTIRIVGGDLGKGLPPLQIMGVMQMIEQSKFQTVERLANRIAEWIIFYNMKFSTSTVIVKISKPAISNICSGPGVKITRTKQDFRAADETK
ncbi:hypothetical protein BT63DRAFT_301471 [Microthyrium microscopicum]|uniref:dihydroneopterin aldolase n=1 Tax=Microthyrium microscopicum TaxID=703497 RepID=A0A6A6U8N8_9PEZI|nr:hypothetical protein BT63DRAFT_301471 [Microthyrium microscopicum]